MYEWKRACDARGLRMKAKPSIRFSCFASPGARFVI
jgi:hypothetical protein